MYERIIVACALAAVCGCGSLEKADEGVKASTFGWDAADATKCLQAALDSGAKKVVIDRQAGDWYCDRLFLRSNQEVVLADGVTVRAKKGCFKDPIHCLFNIDGCTNTVLRGEGKALIRMERDEYTDRSQYRFSEWRHTVYVKGSKDIAVRDLELAFSGGDGIYVCASENVEVRDIDTHDHYRLAACSTGGTRNLRFVRCKMRDTRGTLPTHGFDFEPNKAKEFLVDCVLEDCDLTGNETGGFLAHLLQMDGTCEPLSIVVRRCLIRGDNGSSPALTCTYASDRKTPVRGRITFEDCRIVAGRGGLVTINGKSEENELVFRDCTFDAAGSDGFLKFSNQQLRRNLAGVRFERCRLLTEAAEPVVFYGKTGFGVAEIGGDLEVVSKAGTKRFDFAAFAERNRPQPELTKLFATEPVDYPHVRPAKAAPAAAPYRGVAYPAIRNSFTFLQYAPKAGEYAVTFRTKQLGRKRPFKVPYEMRDRLGTAMGAFTLTGEVQRVTFRVEGENVRCFDMKQGNGYAVSVEPECPYHAIEVAEPINLFGARSTLSFLVPAKSEGFVAEATPEEPVAAKLRNAAGALVREMKRQKAPASLWAKRTPTAADEIWTLEIRADEDCALHFGGGVVPLVSTSPADVLR